MLNGILWWVCTAGGDQTAIQRFMATGNAHAARRSFLVNSIAGGGVSIVLALVGFALLFYYQNDVSHLPAGKTITDNADMLFPYFISHHLPAGLSGLVLAGMFAAAMSSVDSGINSITAVVTSDFVDRFRSAPLGEGERVHFARLLAASVGLVVVITSSVVIDEIPGNFLEVTYRTFGLLVTPMFLLFVFALFIPQGNQWGAISGSLTGFITALLISYWNIFTGLPNISFQWIMPGSLVSGCLVGYVISLLTVEEDLVLSRCAPSSTMAPIRSVRRRDLTETGPRQENLTRRLTRVAARPTTSTTPFRMGPVPLWMALAGGLGWGIRGQYGHETGAMVAGVLVGFAAVLSLGSRVSSLTAARAVALTTIGISCGGSMTYGQTIGLTHDGPLIGNGPAWWWGMLDWRSKGPCGSASRAPFWGSAWGANDTGRGKWCCCWPR